MTQPTKGTSSVTAGGKLRFDPDGDFESLDTAETNPTDGDFTYTAYDGTVDSAAAAVQVTVNGANDAPVCIGVSLTTNEDTPNTTAPDCTDVDIEPLNYAIVTQPSKGMSSVVSGNLRFDPNGLYEGLDTGESNTTDGDFTYKANDGTVDSNTANVDVTVTGVNDAPVCVSVSISVSEDGPAGDTDPSCTDVDVEPLTYSVTQPTKGTSSVTAGGKLRFDPDGDFESLDTSETNTTDGDFTYTAYDGTVDSAAAAVQVTVNGANDAPVCSGVSLTTNEDTPNTTAPDCTDVDIEPLNYAIVAQPSKGTASVVSGNLRFDPNGLYDSLGAGASDTTNGDFTYRANDGTINSNTAAVQVTVTGVNDAPVLTVTPSSVSTQYSDPIPSVSVSATDVDTPGTGLTFAIKDALPGCSVVTALPGDLVKTDGAGNSTLPGSRSATIAGNVNVAPATYARCIEVTDGGGGRDAKPLSVTVTKEDAGVVYTGDMLAFSSGGSANVLLRTTIRDSSVYTTDANPGDIRNATVKFFEGATELCSFTSPLPLLSPPGTTSATVECTKALADGDHTIDIIVDGYYTGSESMVVQVSEPNGSFITGGGYLTLDATSYGSYAGDLNSRMSYGFNVKYKPGKSLNPQGNVNIIFRRTVAGVLQKFQIKSTSIDSLGIALKSGSANCPGPPSPSCWGLAEFRSKANLKNLTTGDGIGGLSLEVSMTDKGEPGRDDTFVVTLRSGTTVLFSSKWNGAAAVQQPVAGGNLVVH